MVRHLRLDNIAGLEHGIDVGPVDRAFTLAQQVEQVLEHMRERGDLLEPEHGRAALDRVDRAEDRVQIVGARRIGVEPQQDGFGAGQVLLRLFEKDRTERAAVAEGGGVVHDGQGII